MFKYFFWLSSFDRCYVGIWFVLNSGITISEAVTLSRYKDRSGRTRDIFVYINTCYHSIKFCSTVTIYFYLS